MLSNRQKKLGHLIRAAFDQPTDWLISNLVDYVPNRDVSRLSIIACLRVLCSRDNSGLSYRAKRKMILARIQKQFCIN